jgi:hypothetical protein
MLGIRAGGGFAFRSTAKQNFTTKSARPFTVQHSYCIHQCNRTHQCHRRVSSSGPLQPNGVAFHRDTSHNIARLLQFVFNMTVLVQLPCFGWYEFAQSVRHRFCARSAFHQHAFPFPAQRGVIKQCVSNGRNSNLRLVPGSVIIAASMMTA